MPPADELVKTIDGFPLNNSSKGLLVAATSPESAVGQYDRWRFHYYCTNRSANALVMSALHKEKA